MNWIIIILTIIITVSILLLLIMGLSQLNFLFQVLYVFICDRESWKKYKRLKKYLKTNTIPYINLIDYTKIIIIGFAFVWYNDTIFIVNGSSVYLSPYYKHLIENLLKHNN